MPVTVKQYSLLDYTLSIYPKTDLGRSEAVNIPIGGSGKYLGSIKFTKSTDNISKVVDATGAGVFAYSHDHSGQIDIEISQVSNAIANIINLLAEKYHTDNAWRNARVDIVMNKGETPVIAATDCMLVKMPDFVVGSDVAQRTFTFLAMEIKEKAFTY